ncbi:MAG: carotenoid biosynthesis protein [bacterium]
MLILELSCLAIILLYFVARAWSEPDRPRLFRRIGLLVLASWIAENTVIHAYGFYQYSPRWSLFLDRVPVMIVIIWPIVITSAWDLMRAFAGGAGGARVVVAAAAMVFADAYVMEPIAVESGLWSWNEPGLFRVPPIGVLGWSFFTGAALAVFDWVDRRRRSVQYELAVLVLPVVFTHLALLAAWWAVLRWVNHTIPAGAGVAFAWALTATLAVVAARHPAARRVVRRDLLVRVPASAFFFVLLGVHGRDRPALIAYAVAFSLPYLVLTWRAKGEGVQISR